MPARLMQEKVVVTINSTGRQAASFIRVASAIGWHVRAQMKDKIGLVADEICNLPNVTPLVGSLEDPKLITGLFRGADIAFINTTHWGDEIAIGRALADAAKKAGIQHYIYSSMPDHSIYEKGWKPLPLWAHKFAVENYIRSLGMPATFVYAGIYHNNFTSLDYPLFRMELQHDGSFVWRAPFNPDVRLPWLDVEHDVGPALLQIFKEGPRKWSGHRIPLAFSMMSPREVCEAFSRGLDRPVYYVRDGIHINVPVPSGYREHLTTLEETLGKREAPYFGPKMHSLTQEALDLWEGFRGMEEYAREVFPIEEAENGLTWMDEVDTPSKEIELDFQGSC